ncbi:methylated-DNA--[protein]-cysteine S-methyltransferase, partial [Pseudomonas aeruginosa]|uniref:methylated-DNA--[protein]-cysteine S-methyltransferase n=1 Tax=Pseudomonas aeruginosa TaxID=287 RepID=UPI0031B701E1
LFEAFPENERDLHFCAANGSNPISIVVPCHRVIGRNGTMTGYAGGVQRKEWLLRHEGYLLL